MNLYCFSSVIYRLTVLALKLNLLVTIRFQVFSQFICAFKLVVTQVAYFGKFLFWIEFQNYSLKHITLRVPQMLFYIWGKVLNIQWKIFLTDT